MTFLWPQNLWLLVLLPLLAAGYVWAIRRPRKAALRYPGLALVGQALGRGQQLRRHVPPALFLVALAAMIAAVARPAAVLTLPSQRETVILAMDVSGSMRAKDVEPTRLAAAQAAARSFVRDQPRSVRIGVIAFGDGAQVTQAPTPNREDVLAAIDGLLLEHSTAMGSGILVSLKAIFPKLEFGVNGSDGTGARGPEDASTGSSAPSRAAAKRAAVEPGSYRAAAIVLLTDGQSTSGPNPVDAARLAAERGVRIFTVGVGTPGGQIVRGEGWAMRVGLDEGALKTIADLTRGEYFYAGSALDLKKIYRALNSKLVLETKKTEVTALFAAGAALLALASAVLSLLWFHRIV